MSEQAELEALIGEHPEWTFSIFRDYERENPGVRLPPREFSDALCLMEKRLAVLEDLWRLEKGFSGDRYRELWNGDA